MDLSQLPERDRQRVTRLLETKQVAGTLWILNKQAHQFLSLYGSIVSQCFKDCINDFTSESLSGGEVHFIWRLFLITKR
jgi:hypothetical protein